RNYRFFFMFISTSTILCIFVFVFSWINILEAKDKWGNIWKAMSHDVVSDFLIIYCFIAVWFVGGLTIFHFYLICTNQTTYENFRYRYDKKENPYSKGLGGNLVEVFFSRIPPSLNNFRAFVEAEEPMAVEALTPNLGEGTADSKERLDLKMGIELVEGNSGFMLPEILQNLNYDDFEDSRRSKEGGEQSAADPFFSCSEQEREEWIREPADADRERNVSAETPLMQDEAEGSVQSSAGLGDENSAKRATDESDSHQTAAVVSQS
ncbi:hypothetical protein CRG98_044644, partial [Punica granatum]